MLSILAATYQKNQQFNVKAGLKSPQKPLVVWSITVREMTNLKRSLAYSFPGSSDAFRLFTQMATIHQKEMMCWKAGEINWLMLASKDWNANRMSPIQKKH